MLSCHQVADYILAQVDPDAGDLISNLKLQKLIYYAQGFHLAIYGEPLFSESIEAWTHGPVSPDLYHRFKDCESNPIPVPDEIDFSVYEQPVREFLDEVYSVFGQFSAWKLRNMTHDEPPWKEAAPNTVITHDAMRAYFSTQITE
ncbi:possible prophage ps3 protein01-like protein [hydrothermal vent metagenome]|uniref:Possible prophage ps3 protein01-like protein n=1 Tax=hydrothermal vent metagenome TaxID=652676 RepID=A0A3B0Y5H6_9ZZZZ